MMKNVLATVLIAACAVPVSAAGLESLDSFIRTVKTARTDFTQVVTFPSKDGQTARSKTSSGTFEFSRPGKFKFHYQKPFEQTLLADGQTLWMHDVDLNQVTARKQSQVLGATPAALIASAPDLRALQTDFILVSDGESDGLQWVLATPKAKDSALQSVRVGLRTGDSVELAELNMLDTFGQNSRLKFSNFQVNPVLGAKSFIFKTPAGADLIRQ
jgi:outer membrane lipoprotein carrier protein